MGFREGGESDWQTVLALWFGTLVYLNITPTLVQGK